MKELKQKVEKILSTVKKDDRKKYQLAAEFRKNALIAKKDSKTVDDLYELEKSRDLIFLEKIQMNIEYENIVNKNKGNNSEDKKIIYRSGNYILDENLNKVRKTIRNKKKFIYYKTEPFKSDNEEKENKLKLNLSEYNEEENENERNNSEKFITIENNNDYNNDIYNDNKEKNDSIEEKKRTKKFYSNSQKTLRKYKKYTKNDLYRKISKICSKKPFYSNNITLETNHTNYNNNLNNNENENINIFPNITTTTNDNDFNNFNKEIQIQNNLLFLTRFENGMKLLKSDEKKHYKNSIFNKKQIKNIIKSKEDLFMDKLKYDYQKKMGNINNKSCKILNFKNHREKEIYYENKNKIKLDKKNNEMNNILTNIYDDYEKGRIRKNEYNIKGVNFKLYE